MWVFRSFVTFLLAFSLVLDAAKSKKKKDSEADNKPESVLISRGKQVSQSSEGFNGQPQRAIDGNPNAAYQQNSCTHTNQEINPWWKIDLGSPHFIESVYVWNRGDCCGARLQSLIAQTSNDDTRWETFDKLKEDPQNGGIYALLGPATGRFVRLALEKNTADFLTLCEVEIFGNRLDAPLISRDKVVSQSSTGFNGPANLANDAKYSQVYNHGTCTHTDSEVNPWWEIDLGKKHSVDSVKVWNRADCCGDRLSSLIVQTSDDGKQWGEAKALGQQATNGEVYAIEVNSSGRFVRLTLSKPTAEFLTLCEVEVYGNLVKE
jgi:hypothetical protein